MDAMAGGARRPRTRVSRCPTTMSEPPRWLQLEASRYSRGAYELPIVNAALDVTSVCPWGRSRSIEIAVSRVPQALTHGDHDAPASEARALLPLEEADARGAGYRRRAPPTLFPAAKRHRRFRYSVVPRERATAVPPGPVGRVVVLGSLSSQPSGEESTGRDHAGRFLVARPRMGSSE